MAASGAETHNTFGNFFYETANVPNPIPPTKTSSRAISGKTSSGTDETADGPNLMPPMKEQKNAHMRHNAYEHKNAHKQKHAHDESSKATSPNPLQELLRRDGQCAEPNAANKGAEPYAYAKECLFESHAHMRALRHQDLAESSFGTSTTERPIRRI
ncbi:hypothetical protein MMC26_003516 [Xylographa opegraphella]|nr:hypothetical protein [Xylographa opegraphella]